MSNTSAPVAQPLLPPDQPPDQAQDLPPDQAQDQAPTLWQGYEDLSLQAEGALVKLASGANLLLGESLMRKLAAVKAELMGEAASPLEKLLAGRIAACWLQVSCYNALMVQNKQATPAQIKQLQQQQDSAHRRYLAALKTLAAIRKLLTPARSPVRSPVSWRASARGCDCARVRWLMVCLWPIDSGGWLDRCLVL